MPTDSQSKSPLPEPVPEPAPITHVQFKAALLLAVIVALVFGFMVYVMVARGVFETTQRLVLMSDDSEGVIVGMDLTFAGFPIGRVRRIELSADGRARMLVDVAQKDAHWLRTSSVFTLERGMVGDTRIRAFSGILADPPLPEGAEREVLRGDSSAQIPRLVASTRAVLENLEAMTASDSGINSTLANLSKLTEKLTGRYGMLTGLLGSEDKAQKIIATLDRTNALLAKTDQRIYGPNGVMDGTQAAITQLTGALTDARASLQKVDAILADAQAISSNARVASADLGALRAEVEVSLRKVNQLVDEVNRKWPFARDTELKLP
jgi:phospholipid/cholesterol/gamma-HCH transport system substrate-binding protein